MKALNRAIGRTVSQIARHAGEGCHVPMIMALENHLDALLTMERKRLEVSGMPEWTPQTVASFNSLDAEQVREIHHSAGANDNAQPAPDAIDMSDPANWEEWDVVLRAGPNFGGFISGLEYRVLKVKPEKQEIYIMLDNGLSTVYTFDLLREDRMFKWLRHGESEAAA